VFPEPDSVLTEKPSLKKYLRYLLFFGPGAIIASATIGQGQLILGPQIGAWAGFRLLWIITLSFGSYFIAYIAARFTLISGINVADVFARIKKGIINWIFIAIILIFLPLFAATIITTLGYSVQWIIGYGNHLAWGLYFSLVAVFLVIVERYRVIEYTQAFFVAVLAIGAIISVALIQPDVLKMIPHFFTIGDVPSYPSWVPDSVKSKPVPLIILGYLGTLTVSIIMLVGYSGWVKVKKWGIFKDKENTEKFSHMLHERFRKTGKVDYLPSSKEEIKKAHLLTKPALIDLMISFIIVAVVSAAYMVAGYYLLGEQHKIPTDINLIKEQAVIFSNIAKWLEPLYKISIFFALFGTIYAGFEGVSRMLHETMRPLIKKIDETPYKQFSLYVLIYLIIIGTPIAISGVSVILMLSITLLFIGVIGVIIYGIGVIYVSQKVLPPQYRLGKLHMAFSVISLIFLSIPLFLLL